MLAIHLHVLALDDDDDVKWSRRGSDSASNPLGVLDGGDSGIPFQFDASDLLLVALLLVACYVFGRIWKGCTYLIIVSCVLVYFAFR